MYRFGPTRAEGNRLLTCRHSSNAYEPGSPPLVQAAADDSSPPVGAGVCAAPAVLPGAIAGGRGRRSSRGPPGRAVPGCAGSRSGVSGRRARAWPKALGHPGGRVAIRSEARIVPPTAACSPPDGEASVTNIGHLHPSIVASLTPCFLAASATGVMSASRRILTICSSLNRVFFTGPSLAIGGHFLKNQVVRKIAGQVKWSGLGGWYVGHAATGRSS
jgi:hypothetical protein